jgi:soluble lytic murein transglycosylase
MALFEARRYTDAAPVLDDAARIAGSSTATSDAFHAARARLRAGETEVARRALRRFVRAHGTDPLATEAEYLVAQSELREGGAHAARAMQRFLDGPRGRRATDFALEARFHLALAALDRGDTADAVHRLEAYRGVATRALDQARADYWIARARERGGDRRHAEDGYRTLVRGDALGWYAILSRSRLAHLHRPVPDPLPLPALPDDAAPFVALPPEAAAYAALGLDRDAAVALARSAGAIRRTDGTRGLVGAYLSLGDFHDAYRVVGQSELLSRPPTGGARWAWDAAYPLAFEAAVREATHVAGIDPELAWAVMRQESAYDPEVVSYADAIGLMQLIPPTAETVARRAGMSFSRDMLYDPTTNVRLGSAYLAELHRLYGVPLCFAAYNAGEHRVDEWLARGETDLDRFVDEIPFAQTRNYTRRVAASLARYRFRQAPDAGWPELGMPERVGAAH